MLRRDTTFKVIMLLPLVLLTGYFLLLVGSQSAFFSLDDFLEQLGQQDIRSAIALSLIAATTALSSPLFWQSQRPMPWPALSSPASACSTPLSTCPWSSRQSPLAP